MSSAIYEDVLRDLGALPPQQKKAAIDAAMRATAHLKWIPNPGPQTDAYFCEADVLLYGGEGGGGKTALIAGLAGTLHERSLIVRRHYAELSGLIDEVGTVVGTKGFTGSPRPKYKTMDKRLIEFGACANPGDEEAWMGIPHDFLAIDEAVQLLEDQARLLMGWVRSKNRKQNCRVLLATNPPMRSEGRWVIPMFRPWLDTTHHNPAKDGELRWFITDPDGNDQEIDPKPDGSRPDPVEFDGKVYIPKSRTFIRAHLSDNPFLVGTGYQATLDAMKGAMRDAVRDGNFMASAEDSLWQTIPTAWIRAAQERWKKNPPEGVPMCAIAADVAQGGKDQTVLAVRHDGWYAPLIKELGRNTPTGREVAALIIRYRRDPADIIIDMGGGYGGAAMEHLEDNGFKPYGYLGTRTATKRTRDGKLGFANFRSQAYWLFREALDPDQPGGSPIMLPDDPMMVADLTAPEYDIGPHGVTVEPKEDVVKRLHRSTDAGDSVIMCWCRGQKMVTDGSQWFERRSRLGREIPNVVMGREARRKMQYGRVDSGPHGRGWGGGSR